MVTVIHVWGVRKDGAFVEVYDDEITVLDKEFTDVYSEEIEALMQRLNDMKKRVAARQKIIFNHGMRGLFP
ncbi:Uncharacterised protein [Providencia stuartii]|nr:Uncharacterised protein [Providencia stuartii]